MIKYVKYFLTGMYLNNIPIPTTGNIPPAICKPLVNQVGITFNISFTIGVPKSTTKVTGITYLSIHVTTVK